MGITNIHILKLDDNGRLAQVQAAVEQKMVDDHRRGKHSGDSLRPNCPLCSALR